MQRCGKFYKRKKKAVSNIDFCLYYVTQSKQADQLVAIYSI